VNYRLNIKREEIPFHKFVGEPCDAVSVFQDNVTVATTKVTHFNFVTV